MIVITGSAGFIGSNIVASLNERGSSDITVVDWLEGAEKWRNLANAAFVDFVPPEELMDWLRGRRDIQAVIHMGAISATTASDGDLVMERNFRFSLRLLDWCTEAQVPFLYASSAASYGGGEQGFVDNIAP